VQRGLVVLLWASKASLRSTEAARGTKGGGLGLSVTVFSGSDHGRTTACAGEAVGGL
jgi:hypothetical protein